MTKDTILMIVGTWIAILPSLGFPNSWDNVLFVISGIVVVSVGIAISREKNKMGTEAESNTEDEQMSEYQSETDDIDEDRNSTENTHA